MKMPKSTICSTAIAALLSLPLVSGAAIAQDSQGTDQTDQTTTSTENTDQSEQSTTPTQDTTQQQATEQQATGDQQQDTLVATVGGVEILGSDVMTVIGMMPPQLQSQPPQMLVPMALEQLILRELILEEARAQDLANDPEVVALVDDSTLTAADDAMVQVWIDRETANVVTDEAVQQVYDQAQAQGQQELPPLEQVRPQIEQFLRQEAMQEIGIRLRDGADVVFFDPTGQPVEQQTSGTQSNDGAPESSDSSEDAADSSDSEERATQDN